MFRATMFRASPTDGVAWVTGASAGIGRGLALRLAGQGWCVAATARRADALASLVAESEGKDGGRIVAYPGDVTDGARMAAIVAAIEEREGPLALAILNAGSYDPRERDGFDAAIALRTIDANLGGLIRCLDPMLRAMVPRSRGQIAVVASLAGYGGVPGSLAYGASKAAMITVAEALRLTYAPAGLTIQVVNSGFVRTAMTAENDYPMPFMMSAEAAAERILVGLRRGGFEVSFPRRLAWTMKAANLLPYTPWLRMMDRATRRVRR